jgi:hypothetical protein
LCLAHEGFVSPFAALVGSDHLSGPEM